MRLLCEIVVMGAVIYFGWETPFHQRLPTSPNKLAEAALSGTPATTGGSNGGSTADGDYIVLRQPTAVRLKYGSATLPAGLSLHIVSKTSDTVVVDYAGEHVTLPLH